MADVADVADQDRHELVERARIRGQLTVCELWLRYVGLGGDAELFDIDGYLAGLLPISAFQQDVLAVAVNERLEEVYRAARVPRATTFSRPTSRVGLGDVAAALLDPAAAPDTTD